MSWMLNLGAAGRVVNDLIRDVWHTEFATCGHLHAVQTCQILVATSPIFDEEGASFMLTSVEINATQLEISVS
jgi:hypothetical protein